MLKFTRIKGCGDIYINPAHVAAVHKYKNMHWMTDCTGIRLKDGAVLDVEEDAAAVAAAISQRLTGAAAPVSATA